MKAFNEGIFIFEIFFFHLNARGEREIKLEIVNLESAQFCNNEYEYYNLCSAFPLFLLIIVYMILKDIKFNV